MNLLVLSLIAAGALEVHAQGTYAPPTNTSLANSSIPENATDLIPKPDNIPTETTPNNASDTVPESVPANSSFISIIDANVDTLPKEKVVAQNDKINELLDANNTVSGSHAPETKPVPIVKDVKANVDVNLVRSKSVSNDLNVKASDKAGTASIVLGGLVPLLDKVSDALTNASEALETLTETVGSDTRDITAGSENENTSANATDLTVEEPRVDKDERKSGPNVVVNTAVKNSDNENASANATDVTVEEPRVDVDERKSGAKVVVNTAVKNPQNVPTLDALTEMSDSIFPAENDTAIGAADTAANDMDRTGYYNEDTSANRTCDVTCAIDCPHGRKTDASGCEICECKFSSSCPPVKKGSSRLCMLQFSADLSCDTDQDCPFSMACCPGLCGATCRWVQRSSRILAINSGGL